MNKIKDFLEYYTTKQQIPLSFKAASSEASFKLKKIGNPDSITIKMSTDDGTTWTDLNIDTTVTLPVGTVCLLSGANTSFSKDRSNYYQFEIVDDIQVYGDLMSLCDYSRELNEDYQFYALFSGCTGIKGTPDLTAYKLTNSCYQNMFRGCTGIVNALDLKAPTLAAWCYAQMFYGCTNLSSAPQLPATTLADYCYSEMFRNCSSLLLAPSLPATELAIECYYFMFAGCTSLTSAPTLPATTLANTCYGNMFHGCKSLSTAPQLPATTLANGCYASMFLNCSNLSSAPQLPAITLANICYRHMFCGCTSLTAAPQLPATTLAPSCYYMMFYGCSNLSSAPQILPATTLANNCYSNMFAYCTILASAPQLPATTLVDNCYQSMFVNCNQLTELTVGFSDWTDTSTTSATLNWVSGITNNDGWFNGPVELEEIKDESHIPINWRVNKVIPGINEPLTFTNIGTLSTGIVLSNQGAFQTLSAIDLHYSINDGQWQDYTLNQEITLQPGDKVAMSGNNSTFSKNTGAWYRFQTGTNASGMIAASGNIMSLMNFSDTVTSAAFYQLFIGNSYLVTAPQLGATTLAPNCYNRMFYGCDKLTKASIVIEATYLPENSCWGMFSYCTSLTSAPELKAVEVDKNCCYQMFTNCISLSSVPKNMLPATTLADNCYYQMFAYCAALTSAPDLPATYIGSSSYASMFISCTSLTTPPPSIGEHVSPNCCYRMFEYCPYLTSAPQLLATTLAYRCYYQMFDSCYSLQKLPSFLATTLAEECCFYMFNNCTSLSSVPSIFPATGLALRGYYNMFSNCTSLSSAPVLPATELVSSCYCAMFAGCKSLTSAPQLPATTLAQSCYASMFWDCTSLTAAPALPATELANWCYYSMFNGCSSLLSAPALPASTLVDGCYQRMFANCTNLSSITVPFEDWNDATNNWVSGVAPTGIFTCPSSLTPYMDNSHIPIDWKAYDTEGNELEPIYSTLTFKAVGGQSKIALNKVGTPYTLSGVNYSINDGEWQTYNIGDIITLSQNDTIALSGKNTQASGFSKDMNNYYQFAMTGLVDCSGSIESLFNYDNYMSITTGGMSHLFESCTGLLTAPKLPFNSIGPSACAYMFHDCWSLTSIPLFKSKGYYTNACRSMFQNCSSLLSAPPITGYSWYGNSSNTTNIFAYMFQNCTSLTGTVVVEGLEDNFVMNNNFQYMFQNCSGITAAQLTDFQPKNDDQYIFDGCKSLTSITTDSSAWPDNGYTNWVRNVAPVGAFYKKSSLSAIYGNNYIPGSWSVVNVDEQEKQPLTFKAVRGSTDIMMETVGELSTAIPVLKYNKENTEWLDFIPDETVVHLEQGETAAFSGAVTNNFTNNNETGGNRYRRFVTTGYYELDGNLQSLFEYSQNLRDDEPGPLFTRNSGMVKAPDVLPAKRIGRSSYVYMFNGCTSLTVAPYIACETGNYKGAFGGMFRDCTSLTHMNSGILNIQALYISYNEMFKGCTSLTAAPDLNIKSVGSHSHLPYMFQGCTALSTPPKFLNCVEKGLDCRGMFSGCTSLTATPPGLEDLYPLNWSIAPGGFKQMFEGCTNLVKGPDYLIAKNAYMSAMFKGCSKLTKAPELRNITNESLTTTNGMAEMFRGCSSLSSITVWFTDWNNETATQNWVSGVAQSGNFECPQLLPVKLGNSNIPKKWRINGQETDNNYGDSLTFIAKVKNSTITLNRNGSPTNAVIYYNKNYEGWTPYEFGTTITVENIGEAVAFSGSTTTFSQSDTNYYQFTSNGTSRFELTGNVMSLVNFTDTVNYQWQFYRLFADCSAVLNTPQLPSKVLQSHCYRSMFDRCYNLTAACQFPTFTTDIKESSLRSMFYGCSGLLTVPEEIDCTTKTVETEGCKYMFNGCTAMSGSISLPASSLNTACYQEMFRGCNTLTGIEVGFEDWNSVAYTSNWVSGITNNVGVFTKPSGLTTLKGKDYIPTGWLVEDGRIKEPLTFTAKSASNISLDKVGDDTSHLTAAIKYNKNGDGWTEYTAGDVISLAENDVVMFSGNNNNFSYGENEYYQFKMTGTIEASGNIQSLMNFNDNVTNYCYRRLFNGCSGLTKAPSLPATTLAESCYRAIFANCTSLSTVPVDLLPATTLAPSCYMYMFEGCTSLTNTPILSATTLANGCYASMFQYCTSLTSTPNLSATNIAYNSVYKSMFNGCSSLISTCELPATEMRYQSYCYMFSGCTSLTAGPSVLPATTLARDCYWGMFGNCRSLTDAPVILATTLAETCCRRMFENCTSLSSINVAFTDWTQATNATYGWVLDVAPTGVFTKPNTLSAEYGNDRIPTNWTVQTVYYPLTFTAKSASNVLLSSIGEPNAITLDYKLNDGQWTAYTLDTQIDLASGDTLAFSGANTAFNKDNNNYYNFQMTGTIEANGNIQSLMNYSDSCTNYCYWGLFRSCSSLVKAPQLPATTLANYCYNYMFTDCTSLTSVPALPATTLKNSCYKEMFRSCTSLLSAPVLPATTLAQECYVAMFYNCTSLTAAPQLSTTTLAYACYMQMFYGCSSLVTAPELPATGSTYKCYASMFEGCTSLTAAPIISSQSIAQEGCREMFKNCTSLLSAPQLPATTLAHMGYGNMFVGCSSLTTPPSVLPATTLANYCYANMFSGCTSLTSSPQLPATTLAQNCYAGMFKGCTNLSSVPSILPATTLALQCYNSMFYGCTNLSSAPQLPATTLCGSCYNSMFQGCTSLTDAPQLPATTLTDSCYYHMFDSCTNLSSAPQLPATTLAQSCYNRMFLYCSNLSSAPQLPATTLANSCYERMFSNCSKLSSISVGFTDWTDTTTTNATNNWVNGVAANGTFYKPEALSTEFGNNRIPTNWTVKSTNPLTFKGLNATNAVCLSSIGSPVAVDLSYSKDDIVWNAYTIGDVIELSANQTVMFKGNNNYFSSDPDNYYNFVMTGSIQSYGNIQSLMDYIDNAPAYCYKSLFSGCTSLTIAPALPATTLANYCYAYMFKGCTNLSSAPQLPATTLASQCYESMFSNCTNLSSAPQLLATTLAPSCYDTMFQYCTNLSTAPQLPATTLCGYCYYGMFMGCTALTSAPQLPATTLDYGCYYRMFSECSKLTDAPVMSAININFGSSLQQMFVFCTSLSSITVNFTQWVENWTMYNWVSNVAPTGIFYKPSTLSTIYGTNKIPEGWTVINTDVDYTPLTFTGKSATNAVCLSSVGEPDAIELQYNKNNTGWTDYSLCSVIGLAENDTIMFSGANDHFSKNSSNYYRFQMTGTIEASGNVQSLMNYSNSCTSACYVNMFSGCVSLTKAPQLPATTLASRCYYQMFLGCSITCAPQLPATTLAELCYCNMFRGCYNLSSAPQLPATTLAYSCYASMFWWCYNLSSAPQLPATTLASSCYYQMFFQCYALTSAPQLPATTLAYSCYNSMFNSCSNLSSAPSLPATTLAENCYKWMFKDCTKLSSAPQLPVTTLAPSCYFAMFYGCSNLSSAPYLPATTLADSCYRSMFERCYNLSSINVAFTNWTPATYATLKWVDGVAANGEFTKPDTLAEEYGVDRIPAGWTIAGEEEVDPLTVPLTFVAKSAGSISFTKVGTPNAATVSYSKNGGEWTAYTWNSAISLVSGDTVAFSGANTKFSSAKTNYYNISTTNAMVDAYGNIQSLLNWSSGVVEGCYWSLFDKCSGIQDTSQLIFPATGLANNCYRALFANCPSVTDAPQIMATVTAPSCLNYAFQNCTSLSSIEIYFTTWNTAHHNAWVTGIKDTSACIFTKPAALPNTRGQNNIPSKWTIVNK